MEAESALQLQTFKGETQFFTVTHLRDTKSDPPAKRRASPGSGRVRAAGRGVYGVFAITGGTEGVQTGVVRLSARPCPVVVSYPSRELTAFGIGQFRAYRAL